MALTKYFYTRLPSVDYTLNQLLMSEDKFQSIPDDWFIILTDIVNSTEYFKAEHYQEINLVAVSSVSVVLNAARKKKITVPFVYGGDGATVFVPPSVLADCKGKLATLRSNTKKRFGMDLRVSIVPVSKVYEAGFSIRVAKFHISSHYQQAIFLGEGVRYAESLMKNNPEYLLGGRIKHKKIDLSGLECKWNALFPPRKGDEVVSLIVVPKGHRPPEDVFNEVLNELDHIYGSFAKRHPIHPKTFSPTTHIKTIMHSSHLKHGKHDHFYVLRSFIYGLYKTLKLQLRVFIHKVIQKEVPDMSTSSDTLKIDDTMKTVFAGSPEERVKLINWLNKKEKEGDLIYGLHISVASVMTCYIKEYQDMHIRFLDGFGGGYTLASIKLKEKMRKLKDPKAGKEQLKAPDEVKPSELQKG